MNTNDKTNNFNNLFERTADEIFYSFLAKHKKKIIGVLITSLITIISATCYWYVINKHNHYITQEIYNIVKLKDKNKPYLHKIKQCLEQTSNHDYQAVLLLLIDVKTLSKQEWQKFLQQVYNIEYVCQYTYTENHFERFSFFAELLFLKTLCILGQKGEINEMKKFFMEKKLQASIMSSYMYYSLAIFNKDNYMLNDIINSYQYIMTNIPLVFISFTKTRIN
jgi:hypothetical protein